MFRRIKNFLWGFVFVILSIGGVLGLSEQGSDLMDPPALFVTLAVAAAVAIYGIVHMCKAFGRNGDKDYDDEKKANKKGKKQEKKKAYVTTMKYVGRGRPECEGLTVTVQTNQHGFPNPDDLKKAIKDLGFDNGKTSALFNGASSSDWIVVSEETNN